MKNKRLTIFKIAKTDFCRQNLIKTTNKTINGFEKENWFVLLNNSVHDFSHSFQVARSSHVD